MVSIALRRTSRFIAGPDGPTIVRKERLAMVGGPVSVEPSRESRLLKAVSNILLATGLARVVFTEIITLYEFVAKTISHVG